MNDLTNEQFDVMFAECSRDIYKYARLIIAHTEQRNMHKRLVPNTNSNQYDGSTYQDNVFYIGEKQ